MQLELFPDESDLAPHRDIACERGEGGANTYRIVDLT